MEYALKSQSSRCEVYSGPIRLQDPVGPTLIAPPTALGGVKLNYSLNMLCNLLCMPTRPAGFPCNIQ